MSIMYNNFVRSSLQPDSTELQYKNTQLPLSGEEASKIYRDVIKSDISYDFSDTSEYMADPSKSLTANKISNLNCDLSNKELFLCVQHNDVIKLNLILDKCPDKIDIVDDYGWSLLMIACQANSIEVVEELLKRNIDVSIRDKAGNSAQTLIIRNKNYRLANLLLNNNNKSKTVKENAMICRTNKVTDIFCDICNIKISESKNTHFSSTAHNINLSKGREVPTNYLIPETNKGFQIMVKGGWDKRSGLGPDGSGIIYPIKPKKKEDRIGLGHRKPSIEIQGKVNTLSKTKLRLRSDHEHKRKMEIYFRRQFY